MQHVDTYDPIAPRTWRISSTLSHALGHKKDSCGNSYRHDHRDLQIFWADGCSAYYSVGPPNDISEAQYFFWPKLWMVNKLLIIIHFDCYRDSYQRPVDSAPRTR